MASPPSPLLVAGLLKKDFSAASLKMICVGNLRIYKKRTAHASDKIYSIIIYIEIPLILFTCA